MSLKEFTLTDLHCVYCSTRDVYEDTTCLPYDRHLHCATCGRVFRHASVRMDDHRTIRMAVLLTELQRNPAMSCQLCGSCRYFQPQKGLWYEDKLRGKREAGTCEHREHLVPVDYHCNLYVAH